MMTSEAGRRVLVCDDEASIIDAYRRILTDLVQGEVEESEHPLDTLGAELFG